VLFSSLIVPTLLAVFGESFQKQAYGFPETIPAYEYKTTRLWLGISLENKPWDFGFCASIGKQPVSNALPAYAFAVALLGRPKRRAAQRIST
jgi:hypothetical protein